MSEFEKVTTPTHVTIARHLTLYRQARGLSQRVLTQQLGAPTSFIGKCEQQGRRIILGEFLRYCAVLEVNQVEFIKCIVADKDAPLSAVGLTETQAVQGLNKVNLKQDFKVNVRINGELIGKHLNTLRKQAKLAMAKVAAKIGIVHSFVGKIEGYDRRLDIAEFIHYCIALNQDASDVLSDVLEVVNTHATAKR